ncbi:hypothetical protein [Pedobacter ginsengisoli]|uniref:hypothetical protein n=1 Tax=Pedobacter ginsengisoli TaxID=363852 RepID=UPI00254C7694|nr:hypothetical protein [Pedobacter ginsengisoli]
MKRLLTITLSMLACISLHAQTVNTLTGTWQIKSFQYGENPEANEKNYKFKKYKSFTPTHFTVVEVDSASGITTTSIFGSYKLNIDKYAEKILHVNRESAGMIGQIFTFTLTLDGENTMRTTGSFNGMKTTEVWTRVPASDIDIAARKIPLYVINNGDKRIILTPVEYAVSPLSIIQQEHIASLEVLKDKSATDMFQDKGKYGVIIITLKEENLEEEIKKLTDKGYIL